MVLCWAGDPRAEEMGNDPEPLRGASYKNSNVNTRNKRQIKFSVVWDQLVTSQVDERPGWIYCTAGFDRWTGFR